MENIREKVVWPVPSRYVIAVSGGVDSIVLLDLMQGKEDYELVVAHVNHGIRADADEDEALVHDVAAAHGLSFYSLRLELGERTSEAVARQHRYSYLEEVLEEVDALAIMTAHHLDDRLETMLLNEQRGAGWLGRAPLQDTQDIKRPLLKISKSEIYSYAKERGLMWHEDLTNQDPNYTKRNRLRAEMGESSRAELMQRLEEYDKYREHRLDEVEEVIDKGVSENQGQILFNRTVLLDGDKRMSRDVIYVLLKRYFANELEIDFDAVVRLEHFYKTAHAGKQLSLSGNLWARLDEDAMVLYVAR